VGNTHLPSRRAVAVALIFEVGHILDHPLVDLRQRQSLVGRRGDRLGDEVRVAEVAPSVPTARVLFGGHDGGDGGRRGSGQAALVARRLLARLHVVLRPGQRPRVRARAGLGLEAVEFGERLHDVEVHLVIVVHKTPYPDDCQCHRVSQQHERVR
jgi:hypothetical protein